MVAEFMLAGDVATLGACDVAAVDVVSGCLSWARIRVRNLT